MSFNSVPSRPEQQRYAKMALLGLNIEVKDYRSEISIRVVHLLPTPNGPALMIWFDHADDCYNLVTDGVKYSLARAFYDEDDARQHHAEGTLL